MTRPLTRIPTVPCSKNTLIRCVIFLCFHLSLNLSPSTHLSACPFFFFLISNDHSFCCFCVWCQYGELNGRQLQKLLNDNFPHGELIYIMHTQNSQSPTKLICCESWQKIWVSLCLPIAGTLNGFGLDTCMSLMAQVDVSSKEKCKCLTLFFLSYKSYYIIMTESQN